MGLRDGTSDQHQQVALWLEQPFTTAINTLNHTVEHVQQCLIFKLQWYMCDWVQAGPEDTINHRKRWSMYLKFPFLLNCLLFPSLHLWPHGNILTTSEQITRRLRLDLRWFYKVYPHNMQNKTSVSQAGWALGKEMLLSGDNTIPLN